MNDADFRGLALGLPGVVEHAEMDHPDFRVGGKVFALLGHPDGAMATVLLPAEQRERFIEADPESFRPASGAWGERGGLCIRLERAPHPLLREALIAAWRDKAPMRMLSHLHE